MDNQAAEIDNLKQRVAQLELRIDGLSRELDRAVRLIDRYGATLGSHLRLVAADQGAIADRLANLERARSRPA
jgi:hypothetical protein